MKPEAYERTLKARAFDVARYLLPLATNTSLGQITNARTLETQVSRLLSHPAAEVRDLGTKLREAAIGPAWNVNAQAGEVRSAPTLVKYAQPNDYEIQTRAELALAATEILYGLPYAVAPVVDLVELTESLEVELAATLLYSASHHPYRQIRDLVAGLPASRIAEIVELGLRHRGKHDEALRAFHAGASLRFDILMDIGGFRDMHRHRRCTQIIQPFTALHGYETPTSGDLGPDVNILAEAGVLAEFQSAVALAHAASARVAASAAPEAAQSALYLLPLATRIRSLFKMDFAEAQYIIELRSGPAGHFSYRRVAWEMFLALKRQHPALAQQIRVTDFTQPINLLQR
jgi:thymidylate synthase ThyX